jgi:hypothetical protein
MEHDSGCRCFDTTFMPEGTTRALMEDEAVIIEMAKIRITEK